MLKLIQARERGTPHGMPLSNNFTLLKYFFGHISLLLFDFMFLHHL